MRTDYAPELGSSWVKSTIHYPENLKGMYCAEEGGGTFVNLAVTNGQFLNVGTPRNNQ